MSDLNSATDPDLTQTIADVYSALDGLDAETKEFATATDQLVKLHRLKQEEIKLAMEASNVEHQHALELQQQTHQELVDTKPKAISKDTLIMAGANLFGIALIIWHERDHVMNRNALGFLKQVR